jgi:hypothetical protein
MADAHSNRLPESFSLTVPDEEAIQEGEAAAERLVSGRSLIDQLAVARALMVGRRTALTETGTNVPAGKPYILAFSRWLDGHPKLKAVSGPERAAALWCVEPDNWPKVQAALKALDDRSRQRATLRGLRKQIERPTAPQERPAPRRPAPPLDAQPQREWQAKLAAADAEIKRLKDELMRMTFTRYDEGMKAGIQFAKHEFGKDIERLTKALHEAVVNKIAEKMIVATGATQPTVDDVAMHALGKAPQGKKVPAFTEREIAKLRKALHPDGKPEELQKMFTEASALFNERAGLLIKSAKQARV